jgi:hypothetical protein
MMIDSLKDLVLLQGQIQHLRRMAGNGRFSPDIAERIGRLADKLEAAAREMDIEALAGGCV